MAKDYFQDIVPPSEEGGRKVSDATPRTSRVNEGSEEIAADADTMPPQPRGIRSISAPMRSRQQPRSDGPPSLVPRRPRKSPRWLIWIAAALSVVVILGLALFAFRSTTVTIVPKSQTIVFGQTSEFIAYPATSAASSTLSYTVQTIDLEDSQVVPAQGTTRVPAAKATGSIVVVNDFSTASVNLIKSTRFESPDGLVYRTPAAIVVPGKKGSKPGEAKVTIVADATGGQDNIGPVSRFTLPGLKTSGAMYTSVYARSVDSMTGGASEGIGPAIAPSDLTAAIADIRGRLEAKVRDAVQALTTDSTFAFMDMAQITYRDLPRTTEAGGDARIHEGVQVVIPVFPAGFFAQTVGVQVTADGENVSLKIVPENGFSAHMTSEASSLEPGPIRFTLTGQGMLVWNVDVAELASALAGRDSDAFQSIVNGFPGIQEAHARIEPFWKSTFPSDPASIKITIDEPAPTQ